MFVCVMQREGECLCIYFVYERGQEFVCVCVYACSKENYLYVGGMVYASKEKIGVCILLVLLLRIVCLCVFERECSA